jgi:hypothetical protein
LILTHIFAKVNYFLLFIICRFVNDVLQISQKISSEQKKAFKTSWWTSSRPDALNIYYNFPCAQSMPW